MGSSACLEFKSRNSLGSLLKKLILCQLIIFSFLISCQTMRSRPQDSSVQFFSGELIFHQDDKKKSSNIDIYVDKTGFRLDLVNPLGQVFWVFIWKNDQYFALFPLSEEYFKEGVQSVNPPEQWEWILKDPSWFKKALLREDLIGWSCENTHQIKKRKKWNSSSIPTTNRKNSFFKKCVKNHLTFEWKKQKFHPSRFELNLEKGKNTLLIRLARKNKNKIYDPDKTFNIPVPPHFKRLKQLDQSGWK